MVYEDKESGVVFHFSSTDWVLIVVPPHADGEGTEIQIPIGSLSRFLMYLDSKRLLPGEHDWSSD